MKYTFTNWKLAQQYHQEIVRDIIKWPEYNIRLSLMNSQSIENILNERKNFLKTKKGKRLLILVNEFHKIVKEGFNSEKL